MQSIRLPVFALCGVCLLLAHGAPAQTLPNAGSTLRNALPSIVPVPTSSGADIQVERTVRPPIHVDNGVRFPVLSLYVTGNTVFAQEVLLALVKDTAGSQRSLSQLEQAAARITEFYRSHGYLVTRAYIPAQDLQDGIVEIAVLEGRYGALVLENQSRTRDVILRRYLGSAQVGTVINEQRLERALLLLQDSVQGARAGGGLRPGAQPGTSDLLVQVAAVAALAAKVEADGYGVRATGRNRLGATLQWRNPVGIGDHLDARLLSSIRGQDYGSIAYSSVVGSAGWRSGMAYAESRYRLGDSFSTLDAYGRAGVLSATAGYPLFRSRMANVNTELRIEHKRLNDHIDATSTVTDKVINVAGVDISGDYAENAGEASTFSLRLESGKLRIVTPAARAIDDLSAHTAGHYTKASYALTHYQPLRTDLLLFVSVNGQLASTNLDSAEKISLGGPAGVRAYPVGEAAGDTGYLASAEIRYGLSQTVVPAAVVVSGFLDSGRVRTSIDQFLSGQSHRRLSGTGVALTVSQPGNLEARVMYARKLGNAVSASDTDRSGRFWLQASKAF